MEDRVELAAAMRDNIEIWHYTTQRPEHAHPTEYANQYQQQRIAA